MVLFKYAYGNFIKCHMQWMHKFAHRHATNISGPCEGIQVCYK
jgi:hypothetical protein